jgi:hypothetical protein
VVPDEVSALEPPPPQATAIIVSTTPKDGAMARRNLNPILTLLARKDRKQA